MKCLKCQILLSVLALFSVLMLTTSPTRAAIIYSNDFETNTAGFDVTDTESLPNDSAGGVSTYLGRRTPGSNLAVLTLTGLTPGEIYNLAFDLYIGGTWDGSLSFGPDTFTLSTSSGGILVNATFRNAFPIGNPTPSQTYSDATPLGNGGLFRTREGADVELGEPIYHFGRGAGNPLLSFTAAGTTEVITFRSVDAQGISDEFFALDNVVVSTNTVVIGNASFETPDIADNSFVYSPVGAPWTFPGGGGIIDPGPIGYFFNFGGTPAPDGSQYGFIQGTAGLSQVVTFPSAGNYLLNFKAAGRPPQNFVSDGGNQSYEVQLDTTVIFSGITTTGSPFVNKYVPFSTTGGAHTLSFVGLATTDNTAFIDAVSIINANAVFIADFNSGTLPPQLIVGTSPPSLTSMSQNVSGGVLNVSAVGAVMNEQLRVGTCFKAVGDYVATVDAVRTVATGQISQGVNWTNQSRFGFTQYNGAGLIQGYAGITGGPNNIANAVATATFRVARVGNTATSSVDTGAGFVTLQSATDVSLAAVNDFGLYLLVENTALGGNQTGSFDNFAITASQFEPGLTAAAVTSTITAGSTAVINASLCGVNPTGTVTVREGAIVLTTQALTNGAAAFNVTGLAVGAHSLIVEYAGDAIHTTVVSAPIVITVTPAGAPQADLSVTTTASPNPASVNDMLTYTAQVTNNGSSSATNVTLASTLTGGNFSFSSITPSQGSCTGTTTATCNLGALANGASATVTITVTTTAAGTIAFNVSAAATEADPNAANNSATATVAVVQTVCSNSLQAFASNLFGAQAAGCSASVGRGAAGGGGGGSFDPFLLAGLALLYLGRVRRRTRVLLDNVGRGFK